jgi:hypothetical protein
LPLPPPPVPPPPAPPSKTAQPNETKTATPDSKEIQNALDRARALQSQQKPPTAKPNPDASRAPVFGGKIAGDMTGRLSEAQRGAIGERVRECWTKDAGALDIEKRSVQLLVSVDATGTARLAEIGPDDTGKIGDPGFRAFYERARRAVLDPRCAKLPLPNSELGKDGKLLFRFRP